MRIPIIINAGDNFDPDAIAKTIKSILDHDKKNEKDSKNNAKWAIIRDAYKGESLGISVLALVDRRKTKSTWWTSDDTSLIMEFNVKSAAEKQCAKLRIGSPRVVSLAHATNRIQDQKEEIDHHEIMNNCGDDEYDGGKDW